MENNLKNKKIKGCQMHPEYSKKCRKCKEIMDNNEKQNDTNLI